MKIISILLALLLSSPSVFAEGWGCSWTDEDGRSGTDLFVRDFYWGGESNDRVITTGFSWEINGGLAGFFDSVAENSRFLTLSYTSRDGLAYTVVIETSGEYNYRLGWHHLIDQSKGSRKGTCEHRPLLERGGQGNQI